LGTIRVSALCCSLSLVRQENFVLFTELTNRIKELINGTMRATINVLSKRSDVCLQMQTTHDLLIVAF